jgi:hypothetical protein
MKKSLLATACVCGLLLAALPVAAQTASTHSAGENVAVPGGGIGGLLAEQDKAQDKKRSPWLLLPLVASSPKMGTSFGALGAYLRVFDPQSQVSMFGAIFEYTSTDSMVGGLFARTSFGADHHRIEGLVGFGYIKNEYEDYLGTGKPFETTDDLRMVAGRYLYRVKGNWFIGAQSVFANYQISGVTELDDKILDVLGITGVQSGGIGAAVMFDSRDNQDMPTRGWYAALNNVANRDWLGAGDNYDAYRLDIKWLLLHGNGHVLAMRQNNQFTHDAPAAALASIQLRGYKMGQYLGVNMSSFEVEERIRLMRRLGATVFAGVGCLYGEKKSCSDSDNVYPSYGAGVQFIVKPEEHMLLNLEYGHGSLNNYGIYLTLGYSW